MEGSRISSNNKQQEVLGMQVVLDCSICSKALHPPVYKCPDESFICGNCHTKLPDSQHAMAQRSSSMERVVDSILVPCKDGCGHAIKYYEEAGHELTCPVRPCPCPVSGCGSVMQAKALFDHLSTQHELPCVDIKYFVPFEHHVEPGTWLLRGRYSRLFLLDVAPATPGCLDHAVSLTCVRPGSIGCSVCFSCLDGHYQASKWNIGPDAAPTQRLCVVPKVSGGGEAPVVLSITIDLVMDEGIYVQLEEEDDDDQDYDVEDDEDEDVQLEEEDEDYD